MKQIQIWLGHSTFSTTADIYAHLDVSVQMETGDVASNFYTKINQKGCRKQMRLKKVQLLEQIRKILKSIKSTLTKR